MNLLDSYITYSSPKEAAHYAMLCRVTQGSTRVMQEVEGVREKCEQEPLLWFMWEEMSETRLTDLGLASLGNFSKL